jgi:hypothetical protein
MPEDRYNRQLLWWAGIAIIVQLIVFKVLYPFAGFIDGDSYVYLQSAFYNMEVNFYPIGYSKFLRLFSIFTKSDTALVAFQYLAIEVSALWFVFTLFYLYPLSKAAKWSMCIFVVLNPVFLYVSNYVSSDALFLALSLTWFTLLLLILRQPTTKLIVLQSLVLLLAFMVRYNALYYPLIGAVVLLFSRLSLRHRLSAIAASFLLVGMLIVYTAYQYKSMTGIWEFTPFSGWQLANNAMYAYRYVDSADRKPCPANLSVLDNTVRHYFDTSRNRLTHPEEMLVASTAYMWKSNSPLQRYMREKFKKDSTTTGLKRWASMAPLYKQYGWYLIREYPESYVQHYLIPNAIKYYTPPEEFLASYNMGIDTVASLAQVWFNYKTRKVKTAFKDLDVTILIFQPILAGVMNIIFLLGSVFVGILNGFKDNGLGKTIVILALVLWAANFGFSIFASPIALRYQLFAITITSLFAILMIDHICKVAFTGIPHSA